MLSFLSTYGLWIVVIGGMLFMHRGHGGHGGGHGGCGGGHASHTGSEQARTSEHTEPKDTAGVAAGETNASAGGHPNHTPNIR